MMQWSVRKIDFCAPHNKAPRRGGLCVANSIRALRGSSLKTFSTEEKNRAEKDRARTKPQSESPARVSTATRADTEAGKLT